MNVLLIEDDCMIGEDIQLALHDEGITVDWERDGRKCEAVFGVHAYDALLLDIGLPYKSGIELLQELRASGDKVPVLILSARDSLADRVKGLDSGADDYLVKPFEFEELVARLRALVRRTRELTGTTFLSGDVSIDTDRHLASVQGMDVILSGREWAILDALVSCPGRIWSRTQLEQCIYGWGGAAESNTVEVHIHGLRRKLGKDFVLNVRGLGYKIEKS